MINIKKEQIHFAFDPAGTPVAYAESGDIVKFCCQDCYCEQILIDGFDFNKMNMQRNNPATGPLYVRGAEPGDVLRVEIKAVDLAADGSMCAHAGAGRWRNRLSSLRVTILPLLQIYHLMIAACPHQGYKKRRI